MIWAHVATISEESGQRLAYTVISSVCAERLKHGQTENCKF
jgi:hypothetical protein